MLSTILSLLPLPYMYLAHLFLVFIFIDYFLFVAVAQFHSLYIYKNFVITELKREFTEPTLQNGAGIAQSV
jgi:hypothetical protein